jgi:predicted nucleotidyltransferase
MDNLLFWRAMDMEEGWLSELCSWASRNDSVSELWLFGSRATGRPRPESDVDLALALMPANGKHDWAFGNYVALHGEWKGQLEAIVGRHVSLEAISPGTAPDKMVRETGRRLWARAAP